MAAIPPLFANGPDGTGSGLAAPNELMRRQAIARKLLEDGSDLRGVDSPLEAFGKVFQTGMGVFAQNRVDQQMRQGQQFRARSLANIIPGKGGLY